ncbi:Flp family type IVb pilin [Jiella sp. M17.18]|uniref:Flp family type IVb pilin n=1 Tax=Jiella sp. M17.18 TaxID=3234247 RepID=UPI0034DDE556
MLTSLAVQPHARGARWLLKRFLRCESGATAIEYSLICVIMSAAVVAAVTLLKQPLVDTLSYIAAAMWP